MAYSISQAYALASSAIRLTSKAFARSLTNNPAAQVETDLEAAAADTVAAAGGVITTPTQAVLSTGQQLTVPVTGTYTSKATVTIAAGAVTAIVLS